MGTTEVKVFAEITGDVVQVAVRIQVGSREAVPPAPVIGSAGRLGNFIKFAVAIDKEPDGGPFRGQDQVRLMVVVEIGPEGVADHPGMQIVLR